MLSLCSLVHRDNLVLKAMEGYQLGVVAVVVFVVQVVVVAEEREVKSGVESAQARGYSEERRNW